MGLFGDFFLFAPYTTGIHDVEIDVHPQMYFKKPDSIPEIFGPHFKLLWIIKAY